MNRKLSVLICSLCTLFYIFGKKSGIMNTFENNANSQKQEGCRLTVPIPHCTCMRNILIPDVELCHGNNSVLTLQNIIQRYGNSSCSDLATLRGANQSVISLSLFGKFPGDYFAGARILAERVKSMYPGWVLRIYHILDMKQLNQHDWLCSLLCDHPHIDTCHAVNLPVLGDISNNSTGMVWRFSVVGDPLIARYAIRDADSSILQREVDAVNDWVKSGKCYHVMRDNYYHHLPVMGGMWGGCNWWKREEALAIREQLLLTRVQAEDQISLRKWIWPFVQVNSISHDSYYCKRYNALPFPTQRINFTFIGQRTYRSKFVKDRIWPPCPLECRPDDHKDWTHC